MRVMNKRDEGFSLKSTSCNLHDENCPLPVTGKHGHWTRVMGRDEADMELSTAAVRKFWLDSDYLFNPLTFAAWRALVFLPLLTSSLLTKIGIIFTRLLHEENIFPKYPDQSDRPNGARDMYKNAQKVEWRSMRAKFSATTSGYSLVKISCPSTKRPGLQAPQLKKMIMADRAAKKLNFGLHTPNPSKS